MLCSQNLFQYSNLIRPKLFILSTGAKPSQLWVDDGPHQHAHITVNAKRITGHLMEIQLITIPAHSFFVGGGYLQHAVAS